MSAELFKKKMADAGLSEAFSNAFLAVYNDLVEGRTGMMPEETIDAVESLPKLAELPKAEEGDKTLLGETLVLKLNGGLGTGMGLEKAKSLLQVKGEDTFLDFIAKQVMHMRKELNTPLKFMMMNSFSTSDDTKAFLAKYPELANDPNIELMQNKAPKVDAKTLEPASWPAAPDLEWCPPGHGDLYAALAGTGKLDALVADGVKYMFVSNSDNLGATMDMNILSYFAKSGAPMCMEVAERTESDKKGGHLCKDKEGKLLLRESAQCPKEDEDKFQDITVHKYFNTNNLWLNLPALKAAMDANNGVLPLPLIRNSKTVDPRDSSSPAVFQLETAMGAAIAALPGSIAICVDRTRFAPVKTCNDLFALKSDAYIVTEDHRLELAPDVPVPPVVNLDSKLYKMVDKLEPAIKNGVPSLKKCKKITVKGPVEFAAGCVIEGTVEIVNDSADVKVIEGTVTDAPAAGCCSNC
jgi:UDP-N-acetylglucosamine pyrophosphorylase